jgi:hypothetical protein
MPLGFQCLHPEGMAENSPRFQPWVNECETISSPGGTEEFVSKRSVAASGAWSVGCNSIPPINRWAIFGRPCGTGIAHVASNPSEAGPQTESRISGPDVFIPKGWLRIAHGFNRGLTNAKRSQVPEGRKNLSANVLSPLPGLGALAVTRSHR